MENKYLLCCPYCSGKLTKSWNETASYRPDYEYQTCNIHGLVSTYSWGVVRTPIDIRKASVIKKSPIKYKLSYDQIKHIVRTDFNKLLKKEPQSLDWNDERVYIKLTNYYKGVKKYSKYKKYMDADLALKYFNIDINKKSFLQILFG